MKDYDFFQWIDEFMTQREGKTNIVAANNFLEISREDLGSEFLESWHDDEHFISDGYETSFDEATLYVPQVNTQRTKNTVSKRKKKSEETDMDALIRDMSQDIKRRRIEIEKTLAADKDELFGQSIAAEIRQFPELQKALIKNEIQGIIFKYQLAQYNDGASTSNAMSNMFANTVVQSGFMGELEN